MKKQTPTILFCIIIVMYGGTGIGRCGIDGKQQSSKPFLPKREHHGGRHLVLVVAKQGKKPRARLRNSYHLVVWMLKVNAAVITLVSGLLVGFRVEAISRRRSLCGISCRRSLRGISCRRSLCGISCRRSLCGISCRRS